MTRITRPQEHEPIRLVQTKTGTRYRAVITTGQHPDGRRRQETKTFPSLSLAREWVSETRLAVRRGTHSSPARSTVADLLTAWEESRRDVRPITLNTYRSVLRPVRARLGAMKVQDVRRSDMDAFVSWLITEGGKAGKGVSHRTVVLTIGTLRQAFSYAVAEGMIPASPAEGVKAPRRRAEDERTVTVWTAEQLAAFIAQADQHEWAALWRLTAAGLRRSEVCGLRWDAVDLDAGAVAVRQGRVVYSGTIVTDDPKSKASRRVVPVESMMPGSVALLRSLRALQASQRLSLGSSWQDSGYVLVNPLGEPIHPDAYSEAFRSVCVAAGVPTIRLHDVRHSLATLLHSGGTAPAHAASLLGHGIPVHLATYVTPTQDGVNAAGAALAGVLAQAQ